MTTQFSDFLAAHAAEVAERCEPRVEPPQSAEPGVAARQLVNAALVALTADDLRPLVTFYRLDQPNGLSLRLEAALLDLQALRTGAAVVAREAGLDPDRLATLAEAGADEVGGVLRTLAVSCAGALERQLTAATSTSSAQGTSLSITMHELRRPLTILNSYGQLLTTGMLGALPETAMVAVEGITASTESMVRMVNSLAELARLEDPDDELVRELIPATAVVDAALEQVAMEAKLRGTTLASTVQPGATVRGDKRRLTLALTNLVGNAVKHGPPDSSVEVTVTSGEGEVHFRVRDHGEGFPPEDAERLFDKYYRSVAERHRKVPGSGLGLYIVRTVVQRHGGRVVARSVPDNGAEFEMILPMHRDEA